MSESRGGRSWQVDRARAFNRRNEMPIILFLCSFLPPLADCQRELTNAEAWQSALFYVLPAPHDAHDEAAERVELAQFKVWAHCGKFTLEDRAYWLGEVLALQVSRMMR